MLRLGLSKHQYGELPVSERALRIVSDRLEGWFSSLSEHEQLEKMRKNSLLKEKVNAK